MDAFTGEMMRLAETVGQVGEQVRGVARELGGKIEGVSALIDERLSSIDGRMETMERNAIDGETERGELSQRLSRVESDLTTHLEVTETVRRHRSWPANALWAVVLMLSSWALYRVSALDKDNARYTDRVDRLEKTVSNLETSVSEVGEAAASTTQAADSATKAAEALSGETKTLKATKQAQPILKPQVNVNVPAPVIIQRDPIQRNGAQPSRRGPASK